ncbi:ankyrin repeat protein [Rutstroemia sp. NJR-2017a BVV2]|nr:ankyrin repeat protein [Rutstroemia sp. NJR-2017a BVV2]
MFLEEGSDVNSTAKYRVSARELRTWSSRPALQLAAVRGNRDVVKFLIEAGADLSTGDTGPSPLFLAAKCGHGSTLKYLLQSGANIEQRDDRGWTALYRAARSGKDVIVTILITAGAIIEAKDQQGWSALHHAVEKGHGEMVLLLLSKGADIDARANDGRSPLQIVSRMGSVHLISKGGRTKKHWKEPLLAKQKRDAALVRLLLEHNANVKMTNSNRLTALHLAAADGTKQ